MGPSGNMLLHSISGHKMPLKSGISTARHMMTTQTLLWAASSMLGAFMILPQHECAAEDSEGN